MDEEFSDVAGRGGQTQTAFNHSAAIATIQNYHCPAK